MLSVWFPGALRASENPVAPAKSRVPLMTGILMTAAGLLTWSFPRRWRPPPSAQWHNGKPMRNGEPLKPS